MKIIYRPIEEADNPYLAKLIRGVLEEFNITMPGTVYTDPTTDNLYALFKTPGSKYWVAVENGIIIGGCGVYPTAGLPVGCVELVKYYLAKDWRGRGIGKELMLMSIESAKEFNYKQIYLESFDALEMAVGIYEKAGFRRIDKPMGHSGHYSCNTWMLLDL